MQKNVINRLIQFFRTDIWRVRAKDLPRSKSVWINLARVIILTIRGVTEDRCQLRASALTLYTVLSIVPVFAMVFGIAKGFGFERNIRTFFMERLEGQEQVVNYIVTFSQSLLEDVKGGLVAGIGIIILLYTIIKILGHIESAFNDIWGVKKPRRLARKVTDYISLIFITPILFMVSSAARIVITSGAKWVFHEITLLGVFSPFVFFFLKFLPHIALWILFTFLYMFIPNTKIHFKSGFLAGIIAGTMFEIFQWIYIHFQVGVARYNAIYGSFAAIPLFFIWLQISWLIVLFGAEIAFAHQNVETYEFEQDCLNVSHSFKQLITLRIVHLLVSHFSERDMVWTAKQISSQLEIPIRLANQLLYDLTAAGIVAEINPMNGDAVAFQPAVDPDRITIRYVIDALENTGSDGISIEESDAIRKLSESLDAFKGLLEKSPANIKLKEI